MHTVTHRIAGRSALAMAILRPPGPAATIDTQWKGNAMSGTICLNGTWDLAYSEDNPGQITGPVLRGIKPFCANVPSPVHRTLIDAGLLDDPNLAMNSLNARWVEDAFWAYRRTFDAPAEAASQPAWLVFERLEMNATVLLNGEEIGAHANVHRPARFDVTGKVRAGENLLVVRLTSGLPESLDRSASEYVGDWFARMTKRHWDRKPQYQCGWDWNPRLMNIGILGDVHFEWRDTPRLDQVTVFAELAPDLARATLRVRTSVEGVADAPAAATLLARVVETGQQAELPMNAERGMERNEIAIEIENPRLWWPVEHGSQDRYTVEVTLRTAGEPQTLTRQTGIRRVEMDQSPHPVEGKYCTLKINNRPVFCKGGNWAPADLFYSEVTPERYRELVDIALGANFNMLRVWGGGPYADHALLDACDEKGVLVWHDFLFACAKYPGDHPEFAAEVRREVAYGTRELAHHPSLVVWCGNNEIEWGDWDWGYDGSCRTHPHYAMFHHDIPKIVLEDDPSTLHWLSSPWSPDFRHPNDPTVGDQHPWNVSILKPGPADWWHYRGFVDRFPNEGGVLGASSPATLRQFLPERERELLSPSWRHHDNLIAIASDHPGEIGRAYETVTLWTGRDPLAMDIDDYAFVSGLLQAEGLTEYVTNYRRRMFSSASAIFWSYNDSWPVTHGWTIVDYYLRRKLAYHPVRRAFEPVTVVVAEEGDEVVIFGVNDAFADWHGRVRYGVFSLGGAFPLDRTEAATLGANASTELARFPRAAWESAGFDGSGAFAVLSGADGAMVAQHRVFVRRFHELRFIEPRIALRHEAGRVMLESPVFVWGVCLDVDGELPLADNCFDLLPGIPYSLPWPDALGEPVIARIGSRDAVRVNVL
jgi:beta-mannosidase